MTSIRNQAIAQSKTFYDRGKNRERNIQGLSTPVGTGTPALALDSTHRPMQWHSRGVRQGLLMLPLLQHTLSIDSVA